MLQLRFFLKEEGFTVSLTSKPHSKIPMDQVIKMTINRSPKETGGLTGKPKNPGASASFCKTKFNHFLVALKKPIKIKF